MKKVFLDDLPKKKGIGANKGKQTVDWKNSIGYKVKFIYDDIEGEIMIVDYKSKGQKLIVKYLKNNTYRKMSTSSFSDACLGKLIGIITGDFKIEIGTQFKDEKRDMIITDREYRNGKKSNGTFQRYKWYKYTCNVCTWTEGWILEGNLDKGIGCRCCSGQIAVLGINTIWDKARWMCDLGVSEEDAKTHTCGSGEKVEVTCPDCSSKRGIVIRDIGRYKTIGCKCGDGKSYPEKFMNNVLNQIGIEFEIEYNPEWIKPKRYDFYIPLLNCIIEVHGEQHYTKSFSNVGGKTTKEEQKNDKFKKESALSNGIEHYIDIDCRESELNWIKNSITNSKLNELFDLSNIDWIKAEEFALSNLVKEVCDYWRNKEGWGNTKDLGKVFNLASETIAIYLNKGTKIGWCNYDGKEELKKSVKRIAGKNKRRVEMFKDGISLGVFESATEIERQSKDLFGINLWQGSISSVCRGEKKHYKGFTFKQL